MADERGLRRIGLLFAAATLIVIGAAGFTVRYQLGISADLTDVSHAQHEQYES